MQGFILKIEKMLALSISQDIVLDKKNIMPQTCAGGDNEVSDSDPATSKPICCTWIIWWET